MGIYLVRVGTDCGNRAGFDDRRGDCRSLAASRHGCRHPFCSSEVCVHISLHSCNSQLCRHSCTHISLQPSCLSACILGGYVDSAVACTLSGEWIAATVQACRDAALLHFDLVDDEGTVAAIFPCTLCVSPVCSKPCIQKCLLFGLAGWI